MESSIKPPDSIWIKSLKWINQALIVITLLAYLAPYLHPAQFGFIALLGLVYPLLLFLNIAFVIYWSIKKRWYFLFSLICILLGWTFLSRNFGLSGANDIPIDSLKIMTFNASSGHYFAPEGSNLRDEIKFRDYVKVQDAEIICLQEFFYAPNFEKLKNSEQQKYHFAFSDSRRLVIASIHPIQHYESLNFINASNGTLFADIEIDGKMLRVYNTHLKSNRITGIVDEVAEEKKFQDKETWQKIRRMFKGYRDMAEIRATQAEELAAHIAQSPYPVVLCGDFNDVPQSYTYEILSKKMTDHFQEKGKGIGSTFAGNLPFLRIDYIMTSPSMKVIESQIIKDGYSDHYPIVSYVAF
ncbi:MAG: endonuclease/exonuclease/phosphatase family protein [Bacteroidota bacterium]